MIVHHNVSVVLIGKLENCLMCNTLELLLMHLLTGVLRARQQPRLQAADVHLLRRTGEEVLEVAVLLSAHLRLRRRRSSDRSRREGVEHRQPRLSP